MGLLPYVGPLLFGAVICAALAVVALRHRELPDVRWFLAFMIALCVWTLFYAVELIAPTLSSKVLVAKVQYIGIATVSMAWLFLAAEYAHFSRWLTRRALVSACVIPVVTLALAWTNEAHGLIWSSIELSSGFPYTVLYVEYGPWFWVHVGFSYLCLIAATGMLGLVFLRRSEIFRWQAALLFIASLSPWAGNVVHLTGIGPGALDLTAFGFIASGVLTGWAILNWSLLAIGPIARDMVVDGMSDAVVVINHEDRVVDANPAAVTIIGGGQSLMGRVANDALGPFSDALGRGEGVWPPLQDRTGDRSYDCRVTPLHDSKGRLRGRTLVLHDESQRVAEAELLRSARRTAEETVRAKEAFLANMSHELLTPMNGVLGMLEVLLDTDLKADQRNFAEIAQSSGKDLLLILKQVLEFTEIQTGQLELVDTVFDPGSLILDSIADVQQEADDKRLDLRLERSSDVPSRVRGDADCFGQVVSSLLSNAIKFTKRGRVQVRLSVEPSETDMSQVRVDVTDTGVGIPQDRLRAIFAEFVQADGSSTRRHNGVGLELTIARGLIERMGGKLDVTSEVGRGSSFWFIVPLRVPPASSQPDSAPALSSISA